MVDENNASHIPLLVTGAIVVLGLLVYGIRDVMRLSLGRIWAISGVCFRDAIRRRVLWITPLAMLGVVIISMLQKPVDQPDAIRQTIKFCFFASALVVTIIALITAATNLPREIENRVVYTIVTKPVTRLEIVLGKITGFARVSAVMLLVMGVFALGYLHLRAWYLGRQITQTLQSPNVDPAQRAWLQHFQQEGLLFSQTIHEPLSLTQYAREPRGNVGRWILGGSQDAIMPFELHPGDLGTAADPQAPPTAPKAYFVFNIPHEYVSSPAAGSATTPRPTPEISVQIMNVTGERVLISAEQLSGQPAPKPEDGQTARIAKTALDGLARIEIPRPIAQQLERMDEGFCVQLMGQNTDVLYRIEKDAVNIVVLNLDNPRGPEVLGGAEPSKEPSCRGSIGRSGQQLRGPESGLQPVAIYPFKDVPKVEAKDGRVTFELKVGIERSGADSDVDTTVMDVRVYDRKNGKISEPTLVYPENRRTAFFTLPAEFVQSGDFSLHVRNRSVGNTIGLTRASLQLVSDRQMFATNLFMGLFVLWLFSVLVSIVAFFCSTFLSWPIAVVLSVLTILGRWAVGNLDIGGSGFGQQVAQEFAGSNAPLANVLSSSVDGLTKSLLLLTSVLPDISGFGVTEQIERGATITFAQLGSPLMVLVLFGLPLTTLAYVFLRNKEVAP